MQQSKTDVDRELARIVKTYEVRASGVIPAGRYSLFNEATLLHVHGLEGHLLSMLKRHGFTVLADKKILDVGCGGGMYLRRFIDYGAQPSNLSGIDLLPQRIERARSYNPAIDWQVGSAHELPYPDASFDLVTSFVLFSSILSDALRQQIADEMWRVLKPGGLILCHDFMYSNPRNPAVQAFTTGQFQRLFQQTGARFAWRRIALAPPIARRVAPHASWLAMTLEHLKALNTHMLAGVWLESGAGR